MFLTKTDRSVVLAGRDFALCHELPRRLEAIDFGTPPCKCSRHVGATRRQLTCKVYACDEVYSDCIDVSECNTIVLYGCTLYIQYVIRDETKGIFGQIVTDTTLQACAYSGQVGALCRITRTSSSVKS
jgi:hypothetical protein